MSHKQTIGGNRLGSGKKMQVDLKTYERSTHDLSYIWRSTMAAGTLVPFISEVGLPGDTFDINLQAEINTHPTIGPLFGSFKVQLDVFQCPVRLYHSALHNNKLGIGMRMSDVKLPQIRVKAQVLDPTRNLDNQQVNPSALLSYLNVRGIGNPGNTPQFRNFNAIPLLSYWDVYKNYYANKQEDIGAFVNNPITIANNITKIEIYEGATFIADYSTSVASTHVISNITRLRVVRTNTAETQYIFLNFGGTTPPTEAIHTTFTVTSENGNSLIYEAPKAGVIGATLGVYFLSQPPYNALIETEPQIETFQLENIDLMREEILASPPLTQYVLTAAPGAVQPYKGSINATDQVTTPTGIVTSLMSSQQGLGIKTYQSDLFNNWMETEWIDGTNGISEITSIDTSSGSFSIDTLTLSRKVYDMLNRIAISGGSYDDWISAVYDQSKYNNCTTPMYQGGLIKELIFQEVVSNSQATGAEGEQPLGTLAGKGKLSGKHKGGNVTVKVEEPSYILGIISLTPRIDYSQGNKWDVHLQTMDDFHKPALDEIGFQDDIVEQRAWWDTSSPGSENWIQNSAGKQPAWLNYMTNVNQVRGNFARQDDEMFMTLNRNYEPNSNLKVADLTTYIDPVKYNQIFAQTSRDAQNFWVQVAVNMTARRKMSAKIMPNL